jgi:adenylate cyclase
VANRSLIEELGRRNVFRVALAYLAGAWLLIQVTDTVLPKFGFTDTAVTNVIIVVAIGFLPAVALAWIFQWTPAGIRLDVDDHPPTVRFGGKAFDRIIVAILALAVGYFAIDKFVIDPSRDAEKIKSARGEGQADAFVESFGDSSILVLPFVNMSPDPDQEYFADGISEELSTLLAKIPELRVISRSTAFTFKGKDVVVTEVAKKLTVAHILEGSVRRSGSKVRITAQLIDARTDTHLWTETYDREVDDIFAIQDDIATMVVADLKLKLMGAAPKSEQVDPQAYELFLRARQLLHGELGAAHSENAAELLESALVLEPQWQRGIFELARAYFRLADEGQNRESEYRQKVWALVERLERIDRQGMAALTWRGWLTWLWQDDAARAAVYFEQAVAADPYNPDLLRPLASFLAFLQRNDLAVAVSTYLLDRDPGCIYCITGMAVALDNAGRYREAAEAYDTLFEWQVPSDRVYGYSGVAWLLAGDAQKAIIYFEQQQLPNSENLGRLLALHDLGRMAEFEHEFAQLRAKADPEPIARVYAWIGEKDLAFHWLNEAAKQDSTAVAESIGVWESLYMKLNPDPRWEAFSRKYKLTDQDVGQIRFNPRLPADILLARKAQAREQ